MGLIWYGIHVLQLLLMRFTQQNMCCIKKSIMKHLHKNKQIENLTSPYFNLWCMFVDFLTKYIGLSNCVHY